MADAEEVLDARVVEDLAWIEQWYKRHPDEFIHSWRVMRPRIIRRLNHTYGITHA